MVVVASTTQKDMVFCFVEIFVLALAFVGSNCDGFTIVPSLRASSRVQMTVARYRITSDNSVLLPANTTIIKATSVDQECDRTHQCFESSHEKILSDHTSFPTNNVDQTVMLCLNKLEDCYAYTEQHIKCPFFRRRYGDMLDGIESFLRFFFIRPYFQDSSHSLGPPISCKSLAGDGQKTKNLPVDELIGVLRNDWKAAPINCEEDRATTPVIGKGYYVTGRMSTNIYRNDCEFMSPDPDLPLKGLRKYIGVASHLFDSKASHSKLISLQTVPRNIKKEKEIENILEAQWKMSLTINLPWKPQLPEFSGSTLYFLDDDHLIWRHEEKWDISVVNAFLGMLSFPKKDPNETSMCPLTLITRRILENFRRHQHR